MTLKFMIVRGWFTATLLTFSLLLPSVSNSQSRIEYDGVPLFMSGANVAWVNFGADIGPGNTNFTKFSQFFDSVHAAGGNVMRLWLHTNGAVTPEFNTNGIVVGPGANAISDLQQILDLAYARDVGLVLCLWSFDMLRQSFGTTITDRSYLMLTDADARSAYIQNSLIPMVTALKGHPGIVTWEVFNEAEGMSNEYGWSGIRRVPMSTIQTFVNLVAGAIHRTDSTARVTTGAWAFIALSDVTFNSNSPTTSSASSLSQAERERIEAEFYEKYQLPLTAEEILAPYSTNANNYNFYRDDRLVAAGGDADGTLDFYTVHYYDWGGTAISPFHHPFADWNLGKPCIVAEFYAQTFFGIDYPELYDILINTGYAGGMTWQWINNTQQNRTKAIMRALYAEYPSAVIVDQVPGTVYSFTASRQQVEPGQSVTLSWATAWGSVVTFNDVPVASTGDTTVTPTGTTEYVLAANGVVFNTASVTVTSGVTDVPESQDGVPLVFALEQNYPNPFNPSTTIRFAVPARSDVRIAVYDLLGREVAPLRDGPADAGYHDVTWNADVPSGIYFCRMSAVPVDGKSAPATGLIKMVLMR
ncbi:MAG TPA: T9SS type A sorting domain-containing protein [Bacteroidota bacterium]|nr:T9SS type A sorting domain-containing protein [Bacteroidota bacterium]